MGIICNNTVYITTTEVATFMCDVLLHSYHRCPVQEIAFPNVEGIDELQ